MNFDYSKASLDDLDQRAVELLVLSESKDLAAIIKGHLFIERILDRLIQSSLKSPEFLQDQRLHFYLKIDLACALGVLPNDVAAPIRALNKIRNKYAHSDSYQVSFEELETLKCGWEPIQEQAYQGACTKGVEEAALIATLFLTWACQQLVSK